MGATRRLTFHVRLTPWYIPYSLHVGLAPCHTRFDLLHGIYRTILPLLVRSTPWYIPYLLRVRLIPWYIQYRTHIPCWAYSIHSAILTLHIRFTSWYLPYSHSTLDSLHGIHHTHTQCSMYAVVYTILTRSMFDLLHGTYIPYSQSMFHSLRGMNQCMLYSLHVPGVVEGGLDVPHRVRFEGTEEGNTPAFFDIDHVPLRILFVLGTWRAGG